MTTNETPLFLQDSIEYNKLHTELKNFIQLLNNDPHTTLDKTYTTIHPHSLNTLYVGQKETNTIRDWWFNQETKQQLYQLFINRKHKVADEKAKDGDWCCGFQGSRWCDITINKRRCRLEFYTKSSNPTSFLKDREGRIYAIRIDPTR